MRAPLNFKRFSLVKFLLFLLALKYVFSVTYHFCDDEDESQENPMNVCGFSLLSVDKHIKPLADFTSVSNACKSNLVVFAIEGYCDEFKQNSAVCSPYLDVDCFSTTVENKVCAYQSTQSTCTESPCRQTVFNYCSACLFNYLFYTQGPCE